MHLNPVRTPDHDGVFADMARTVKLSGTMVHVTALQPGYGAARGLAGNRAEPREPVRIIVARRKWEPSWRRLAPF